MGPRRHPRARARGRPRCCYRRSTGAWTRRQLVSWMLRDRVPARLNLQLHKYIWDPMRAGCRAS